MIKKYEADDEIIVVDYNSDVPFFEDDTNPVKDALNSSLEHLDLKFLIVPPETAHQVSNSTLSEVHALNLAAREAVGSMLLRIDQDTMVGSEIFSWLKRENVRHWLLNDNCPLSPKKFRNKWWWSGRRDSRPEHYSAIIQDPVGFTDERIQNVDRWASSDPFLGKLSESRNGKGAVGVFGAPKKWWHMLCGYDEHMTGWGHMELEYIHRLNLLGDVFNIDDELAIIQPFIHIFHSREQQKPTNELPRIDNNFPCNERWGMKGAKIRKINCENGVCVERK
eukprot:CAMPEP_0114531744 /NCGR_PEP_ID=MMETSP0109-20121206/26236_1 /TAXON_ID=29199 /ORGANISM="Chlorarachnion reptans, Strain CCCM449" /LENGTH=278 /DNA_ID=CAMNT_0001714643 /DNA_START=1591 /DNA_END=2427 /DNA_ORIENTATION=+